MTCEIKKTLVDLWCHKSYELRDINTLNPASPLIIFVHVFLYYPCSRHGSTLCWHKHVWRIFKLSQLKYPSVITLIVKHKQYSLPFLNNVVIKLFIFSYFDQILKNSLSFLCFLRQFPKNTNILYISVFNEISNKFQITKM